MLLSMLAKFRLPRREVRRAGALATLCLTTAVCVATEAPLGPAHSQVVPAPGRPPASADLFPAQPAAGLPTAGILRRIAEAVDGHRTGRQVWVVLRARDGIGATAVVESRDSANAVVRAAHEPGLAVYGPFATSVDAPTRATTTTTLPGLIAPDPPGPGCVHRLSVMQLGTLCPGLPTDIVKFTVTLERLGGVRQTFAVPLDADALFFGMSAIDKFVMPYYTYVIGVQQAAAMRQTILSLVP